MNTDDIDLAYKVRHALNEQLDALPPSTTERLAAARARAVARKKADASGRLRSWFVPRSLFAGPGRMRVAVPLLALVAGLAGVYQYEEQQRIAELAELDAAVLADELPLTAYLDDGFNAYLDAQQQQRHQ
jgi:hypothetical protein